MSTTVVKTCPKCGSREDVVHGAIHGHPLGLLLVAGCWLASRLVHRASKPWTCKMCHLEFA